MGGSISLGNIAQKKRSLILDKESIALALEISSSIWL